MIPHTESHLAIAKQIQRDRLHQAERYLLARQARQAGRSGPDVIAARSWAPARWRRSRRLTKLAPSGS